MQWLFESMVNGLFVGTIGLVILWHWLNKRSPELAGAMKKAALTKTLSLITKLMK